MIRKLKKFLLSPLTPVILLYLWLLVDTINGILARITDFPVTISNLFKVVVLALAFLSIRSRKHLFIALGAVFIVALTTVVHLFNPLSEGIPWSKLIYEDLLAGAKLISPTVFTVAFLSGFKALKEIYAKHLRLVILTNLLVIGANILIGLIGVGYSQYKAGIGTRGLFLSGNELALVFFTIFSSAVFLKRNLKTYIFIPLFILSLIAALFVGTKVAVLGTTFMLALISLILRFDPIQRVINRKGLLKKHLIWLATFSVLAIGGLVLAWKLPHTHASIDRWIVMIDMADNTFSGFLSQRDTLARAAITYIQNHFTIKDYIFGIGFDNISRAMSTYPPHRFGIAEMDIIDMFMHIGAMSVLYYGLWLFMLLRMLRKKPFSSFALFGIAINLVLLFASTLSGHTLYSAVNAPFWAIANVIGLQGIHVKLGLNKVIKTLYKNKLIFVLPACFFIGIDALSTALRQTGDPTITLSIIFKGIAVLLLLPVLNRKQIIFLLSACVLGLILAGTHILNPLTATSGVRAVLFGDLQLMFKLLLPVTYAFAFFELGKTIRGKEYRLALLSIFALNLLFIFGNQLIGILQLHRTQALTSIPTMLIQQKGLMFSWNEFSIGYVTIGSFLLYQFRNKHPVLLVAFALLLIFGTFMIVKKVSIFGTALFVLLTFVIFRYDFIFRLLNKQWTGIKRYLIWLAFLAMSVVLVFGYLGKHIEIAEIAPSYQADIDRVDFALDIIFDKEADTDPALEALFSGRNRFIKSATQAVSEDFSTKDLVLGIGYRNINEAVGKHQPHHPGITEIDPFDLYMAIGLFGIIYYLLWGVWTVWLATRIKRSPYFIYIVALNLFLMAASATSGHVVYSGLNGAFFGILNGVALAINYHTRIKDRYNLVVLSGMGKGGVRAWVDTIAKYFKTNNNNSFKIIRTHYEVHRPILNTFVYLLAILKICVNKFLTAGEQTIYHLNVEQGGSYIRAALCATLVRLFPKGSIVLHIHGARFFEYTDKLEQTARGKLLLFLLLKNRSVKTVISLTKSRKLEFDNLIEKHKLTVLFKNKVVPNPINFKSLKSTKQKTFEKELTILSIGRYVEQKNQIALLKAIKLLVSKGLTNVHLNLVGEGELRKSFEHFIAKNRLSRYVTLAGWADFETKKSYLENAHIFVLPSTFESFGIVALEAYANRLPIVASNIGGLKDLVEEGINGYKVDPADIKSLADAIKKFFDNPEMISRMGKTNYEKAQKFDIANIGKQLGKVYADTLKPEALRLLLIASSGGHLNQLMMLRDWWSKYWRMFVAYDKIDGRTILKNELHFLSKYTSIRNPLHVFGTAWIAFRILKKYRPHVIFSTGEGLCVPFFYIGKYVFGARTILLDSLSKTHPSLSAYLSYFVVDELLTQWPDVSKKWKKFKYKGRVI